MKRSALLLFIAALAAMPAFAAPAANVDFLPLLLDSPMREYRSEATARIVERHREIDDPTAASEFRLLTMKDEHGRIPPGALMRANQQRRDNLAHGRGHSIGRRFTALSTSVTSWTNRGPQNVGGRTLAIVVHPSNNQTLYAGAASGGVWKSTNGGTSWSPTGFMANLYVSALIIDPLSPSTLYAGTGERMYDRDIQGAGVFKSTDNGDHWTQLSATASWTHVTALALQPGGSNTLLASTTTGIFRTTDGGQTWPAVTVPALQSGLGVAFNPAASTRAVAAVLRNDGTVRAYYSSDGGGSFSPANGTTMAVADPKGDMAVAFAPSRSSTVYALVNAGDDAYSEMWRSTDNGVNYTRVGTGNIGCVFRRCAIWVSPTDPVTDTELVVTGGIDVFRGTNGSSFSQISSGGILTTDPHPDVHCFASNPIYDGIVYVGTDGGVWKTSSIVTAAHNTNWSPLNTTYQTTQFYSGAGHAVGAGAYIGGTQDNVTLAVTNTSTTASLVGADNDGGFVEIDPTSVSTWYFEYQYLQLQRSTNAGAGWQSIWNTSAPISDAKTSFANFVSPFVLDPNHPATLYAGGTWLWRTTNALAPSVSWSYLYNNSNPISAIAIAPSNSDVLYLGHNNGSIQKTTNATAGSPAFTDVDNNSSVNPLPDRFVTRIYIDPSDSNTVYVALGGYASPNLWKSSNGGISFAPISGSGVTALPSTPIRGFVRHPRNAQRLYAGTEVGLYESEDGGQTWSATAGGPEDSPIDEVRFVLGTETLLVATHGRGLWTTDVSSGGVPTAGPAHVVATATGTSTVNVTWDAVSGATSYNIYRTSDGAPFGPAVGTATTTSFPDSGLTAGKTYLYKVNAVVNSTLTNDSNVDLATTILFTNDNDLVNRTIDHINLQEIRNAVNAVRAAAAVNALTFSNPASSGSPILATDITDLRTGLAAAYTQLNLTPPTFAETITAGTTLIKASHWQEIRNATK
jgi:hypothetical protein